MNGIRSDPVLESHFLALIIRIEKTELALDMVSA